jgi:hypothetical protein
MKHIYTFLFFSLSLFLVPLKAQNEVVTIECYGPSLSELYTMFHSDLVIYGQVILNHGPFTQFKIEELIKQDGLWFGNGDTVNIFIDDVTLQKVLLENHDYQISRVSLKLGIKHWQLTSGTVYSLEPLKLSHSIDMRDQVIALPANQRASAQILQEFLSTYKPSFSEGIPAQLKISAKDLERLKKTNPIIAIFEKQERKFLNQPDIAEEVLREQIYANQAVALDTNPQIVLEPQLLDSTLSLHDIININDFKADDDSYGDVKVRVIIKIFIDEEGRVYKTELVRGYRAIYDNYALNRAKQSGPWKPLIQRSRAHKGYFNLPFYFKNSNAK